MNFDKESESEEKKNFFGRGGGGGGGEGGAGEWVAGMGLIQYFTELSNKLMRSS